MDKYNLDTVGGRVTYLRKLKGWTQEELAEAADVSVQFISSVEQGRTNVRSDYIVMLARVLEVSVDFILEGKTTPQDAEALVSMIGGLSGPAYIHLRNIVIEYCKSHGQN